jgi:hypothetical protein
MLIQGTLESKKGFDLRGTLRINAGTVTFDGSNVALNGTIDIWENGTLELKNSPVVGGISGALIANGTVNVTGAAPVTVSYLRMETGSLTIATECTFTVTGYMVVGAMPTLLIGYVNGVQGIGGKITISNHAYAFIYGNFGGSGIFSSSKSTAYVINSELYVTVYVSAASTNELPALYGNEFGSEFFKDITIFDWCNNSTLSVPPGEWLSATAPVPKVGDTGWKTIYADFEWKQNKVTVSYNPGINWAINGIYYGESDEVFFNYGTMVTVKAHVATGYVGTPVVYKDGAAYNGSAFKLTDNTVFTASGVTKDEFTSLEASYDGINVTVTGQIQGMTAVLVDIYGTDGTTPIALGGFTVPNTDGSFSVSIMIPSTLPDGIGYQAKVSALNPLEEPVKRIAYFNVITTITVSGKVILNGTTNGIGGVTITCTGALAASYTTAADGSYAITADVGSTVQITKVAKAHCVLVSGTVPSSTYTETTAGVNFIMNKVMLEVSGKRSGNIAIIEGSVDISSGASWVSVLVQFSDGSFQRTVSPLVYVGSYAVFYTEFSGGAQPVSYLVFISNARPSFEGSYIPLDLKVGGF